IPPLAPSLHDALPIFPNRGTRNTRVSRPPASSKKSARRALSNVLTPGVPSTKIGFLAGSAMSGGGNSAYAEVAGDFNADGKQDRSEEHTSELQSPDHL